MHKSIYGEKCSFINTWHRTKVSSLCRLYGSVDLMAIDQMGDEQVTNWIYNEHNKH
ncbi:hypothetical protein YC2023_078331 [Brassica napus]